VSSGAQAFRCPNCTGPANAVSENEAQCVRCKHRFEVGEYRAPETENELLAAALGYARAGLPVFPCRPREQILDDGKILKAKAPLVAHGFKDASKDERTIVTWWTRWPDAMIGAPTGSTGVFVVDVDGPKGEATLAGIESVFGKLPPTKTVKSGRADGGRHLYFKIPPGVKIKSKDNLLGEKLDVKAHGGYTIIPPSIHPSGSKYTLVDEAAPLADAPYWLLPMILADMKKETPGKNGNDAGEKITHPGRHPYLVRQAAKYRAAGDSRDAVLEKIKVDYRENCTHEEPEITEKELREIAEWSEQKVAALDSANVLADAGNAALVKAAIGDRVLFCQELDLWLHAGEDERWKRDRTDFISRRIEEIFTARWEELSKKPNPQDPLFRFAMKSLNLPAIRNAKSILEFQPDLNVLQEDLDSDGWLFGCANGILNLRLGELVRPRRDLLVTRYSPTRFDPAAKCEKFLEFLARVQPDPEVRAFLWRLIGCCLTGLLPEESFIFFLGVGANGKTTFARAISRMLGGDYAWSPRKQLLFLPGGRLSTNEAAGANDIIDLQGRRLLVSVEQVGRRWNLEFLKAFTGGDILHGRQLYLKAANVKPTAKILICANDSPSLDDFSEALRRRFVLLPWSVIIPPAERRVPMEAYLDDLLADGGDSGILNLALDGLLQVVKQNWRLQPPAAAKEATMEYINSEDRIRRFLAEWFEDRTPDDGPLTTKELRRYYIAWCDEPERYCMSPRAFTNEIRKHLPTQCRLGHGGWYIVENLRPKEHAEQEYRAHIKRQKEKSSEAKKDADD
jgi:putative DNA primase/helicase